MQLDDITLYALGDSVLVVQFSDSIGAVAHDAVMAFGRCLADSPFVGMIEYVPAFTTVSIFYNPVVLSYEDVQRQVMDRLLQLDDQATPRRALLKSRCVTAASLDLIWNLSRSTMG
ncbi:hypothetical protein GCM10025859_43150 [Alicyclobacillus fastidiosus]|nr:hypothetical protein GCM10025859_43150 [Alicyclobacillus fastidiosus]